MTAYHQTVGGVRPKIINSKFFETKRRWSWEDGMAWENKPDLANLFQDENARMRYHNWRKAVRWRGYPGDGKCSS